MAPRDRPAAPSRTVAHPVWRREPVSFQGYVGTAPLGIIPAALRSANIEPGAVLRRVELDPQLFSNDKARISFPALGRLLGECVRATGQAHFGLLAGRLFELSLFGPLGYLMLNEATVGAALRRLVRHMHLNDRGAVASLSAVDARHAALSYAVYVPGTPAVDVIDDTALAMGQRIMKSLCGPRWRPVVVHLAHARPAVTRRYREIFDAPVHFDAPLSQIVFESRALNERIPGADPKLCQVLTQLLAALELQTPSGITEQVRRVLRTRVLTGATDTGGVAELLEFSERTLRRKLAVEGASFHRLLADARGVAASQLLVQTNLSLSEIAAAIGYSECSSFSRAFRAWTGVSPTSWRQSNTTRSG
jgi:AraC-like DNA-binding protein